IAHHGKNQTDDTPGQLRQRDSGFPVEAHEGSQMVKCQLFRIEKQRTDHSILPLYFRSNSTQACRKSDFFLLEILKTCSPTVNQSVMEEASTYIRLTIRFRSGRAKSLGSSALPNSSSPSSLRNTFFSV